MVDSKLKKKKMLSLVELEDKNNKNKLFKKKLNQMMKKMMNEKNDILFELYFKIKNSNEINISNINLLNNLN